MSAIAGKPGESLIGLVGRAARRNHLPRLRALLGACTPTWHAHLNLASRDDIDFNQLAHAARLAPHELEDRRYRSVALTPDLPGVEYHGAAIPAYDLQLRPRRLATSWLVDEPIHCALGHHALATHCPISGNLLIDRCARCKARLNWSGLDLVHCSQCGFDLRTAEVQRVTERELRATRPMLDLIHPDPARNRAAANRLPHLLSGLNRGTLFELGWRCGNLMSDGSNGPRIAARHLSVATRLRILEIGSTVLASWPESVRSAMQGRAPGRAGIDPKLPNAVRSVAKARNAWPAIREAIFAGVPGLATSARTGVRSVLTNAANGAELTRSLGVSQRVFERMRAADTFTPVSSTGAENIHQIFDANQAEHFRSLLSDRIPLASASERLDISAHGAEQLCCLGELHLLNDDAVLAALKWRQITKSSLETLCNRLEEMGTSPDEMLETDLLPIRRALRSFGGQEKPWGPIVAAMLAGKLPFMIRADKTGRLMDRVSIPASDVHLLAAMRFDAEAFPAFNFHPRINRRDAEELLNIDAPTFSRAIKNSDAPASDGLTYDRQEVLKIASKTLSVSEALVRWGCGGKALPTPLKGRHAPIRIGKLGWNRAEAERAMAQYGATDPARIKARRVRLLS
ncbi:hypothetical protein [Sphingomonas sp. AX6]|uniref:hypothetical protein n=1 Tax=Sphingomonas sp. AX6 TaxID=2653171 RepID=UPI00135C6D1D|nr:hypothetical protein [Sphingomonas sp. AX6]